MIENGTFVYGNMNLHFNISRIQFMHTFLPYSCRYYNIFLIRLYSSLQE